MLLQGRFITTGRFHAKQLLDISSYNDYNVIVVIVVAERVILLHKPSVGLREAKENLSRLVNEVKKGTEIILTERGKPVARLTPIASEPLSLTERLTRLEYAGWLEPLNRAARKMPAPLPLPGEKAQELLQEDRNS